MRIERMEINNYRSIKHQVIDDIKNSLIAIGKNNAGKSTILNAIRVFCGECSIESTDFYKGSKSIEISITFSIEDDYIKTMINDKKIGFSKIPSSSADFNKFKDNTNWANVDWSSFKAERTNFTRVEQCQDSIDNSYYDIWIKAFKGKFVIEDKKITVTAKAQNDDCKLCYCDKNSKEVKDILAILPNIAYIGDDRNFDEEQFGKAKTLTGNIFNNIITNEMLKTEVRVCKDCNDSDCEKCVESFKDKSVGELTVNQLEKMISFKANKCSEDIKNKVSKQFQENYKEGYLINIQAKNLVEKSFSVNTKIYDPMLDKEIELSNVGAGIRSIYILSLLQAYQEIMGRNSIFIMEEPELYLHPQLQKEMARTLLEISENNQVIFTTHSPIMLKNFDIEDIRLVKLDLDNYETIINNVELQVILDEIGYTSQDIINSDFVLFVEGKDDKAVLEKIILKYYDINLDRITIIDTKSCQNIETYATLRFLDKTTLREDFAIFRDADTMEREFVKSTVMNKLRENIHSDYLSIVEKRIFITKFSSIEGYLIDIDLILEKRKFASKEKLESTLISKLSADKTKNYNYFSDNNKKSPTRIEDFSNRYDDVIADPLKPENLEWLKTNIRGHNLYGYLNAKSIKIDEIIDTVSPEVFEDIFGFLNTIKYFNEKRKNNSN